MRRSIDDDFVCEAYVLGAMAADEGLGTNHNPYLFTDPRRSEWNEGLMDHYRSLTGNTEETESISAKKSKKSKSKRTALTVKVREIAPLRARMRNIRATMATERTKKPPPEVAGRYVMVDSQDTEYVLTDLPSQSPDKLNKHYWFKNQGVAPDTCDDVIEIFCVNGSTATGVAREFIWDDYRVGRDHVIKKWRLVE